MGRERERVRDPNKVTEIHCKIHFCLQYKRIHTTRHGGNEYK